MSAYQVDYKTIGRVLKAISKAGGVDSTTLSASSTLVVDGTTTLNNNFTIKNKKEVV